MRLAHQALATFRALFRSAAIDADLAQEMQFHVDRETEANMARGMAPAAARRAARLTFGSVDASHEQSRDERPGASLRTALRDLRFGVRLFRKSPGFSIVAVAIIALGLGAATAIFSVVHGVMLCPLPFREPEQLASVWLVRGTAGARSYPSAADVMELRQLHRVFESVAFFEDANLNLTGNSEPRRLKGARVSANFFDVLGVSTAFGRTFHSGEEQNGSEHVVVLSDALWRGRFGADSAVVGQQVNLNEVPHTIVGVMRPNFLIPSGTQEAWVPLVLDPRELTREMTDNYRVVARLAPGASVALATREVTALAERLAALSASHKGPGMIADAMLDDTVRTVRPALNLLLGAVACLLLIACANLSNLFGARARARSNEFAVRLALGATRGRLIAQTVAETAPALVTGGILGIVAAQWAIRVFVASAPAGVPRVENISLSPPVIAFSVALLALSCVAVSVAPAAQAWSSDFTSITKDGGRASTAGRRKSALSRMGAAAQIAFALPLLAGACLLLRSAINLTRVDLGFEAANVATVSFEVSRNKHRSDGEVAGYYGRLVEAVRGVPGVTHAALVNRIPLAGAQSNAVRFENPTGTTEQLSDIDSRTVTPEYFATLGIPLVAGRAFSEHDDSTSNMVGIVDERVAASIWPGETVIGKRFSLPDNANAWVTIIGVVGHVRTASLEVDPRPQVYWSYRQWTQNRMVLAVRGTLNAQALVAPVVRAIRSVDPDQSVYDVRTLSDIVGRSLAQRRLTTTLIVAFGSIALLLAAIGIYGVVAYGVTRRMREFGIRVALGASTRQVTQLVVWQGTSMAIVGAGLGLILAVVAARGMATLVYGIAPTDVASLLGATALLLAVTTAASYLPARRASRVDPNTTLRAD